MSTDVFKATIDGEGGTLSELQLLQFLDQTNHGGLVEWARRLVGLPVPQNELHPVLLMENGSPATRYVAQTGLLNTVDTGDRFPNHLSLMTARPGPRELADGQNKLEVVFESQPVGGIKYVKTYVFQRGDYTIRVNHQVVNVSDKPRDAQLYLQFTRHGTVAAGTMFGTNTFTGPAIYTEQKKFQKIDFSDINKGKVELPAPADNGWVAMVQHYFVSAWLLNVPGSDTIKREFRVADLGNNLLLGRDGAAAGRARAGRLAGDRQRPVRRPQEEKKLEASRPASNWSRTTASSRSSPSRSSGCSTSCTASSATGAGRSSRWWCC